MAHSLCLCIIFREIGVFFAVKRRAQANRSFAREKRIINDELFCFFELRHNPPLRRFIQSFIALIPHLLYYNKKKEKMQLLNGKKLEKIL